MDHLQRDGTGVYHTDASYTGVGLKCGCLPVYILQIHVYCTLTLHVQGKSDLELERAQLKEVSERLKREEAEVSQLRHDLKLSQGQVRDDERMHVFTAWGCIHVL